MSTLLLSPDIDDVWDQLYENHFQGLDIYFEGIAAAPNAKKIVENFSSLLRGLSLIYEAAHTNDYPLQIGRKQYLNAAEIAAEIKYLSSNYDAL